MNFQKWELFSGSPGIDILGSLTQQVKEKILSKVQSIFGAFLKKEYLLGHREVF